VGQVFHLADGPSIDIGMGPNLYMRSSMKNVMKLSHLDSLLLLPEETVVRLGSVGIIAGSLLALVVLMF
jgi:hypothetical protein